MGRGHSKAKPATGVPSALATDYRTLGGVRHVDVHEVYIDEGVDNISKQ